uniref:Uncharacterized protein n=1 Tax=Oryza punctata TaxID=4537 RepID=A0A0E0JYE2_ORYPU
MDGTHVSIVSLVATFIEHMNRIHVTTRNVLAICDHDAGARSKGFDGSNTILSAQCPKVTVGMGFLASYPHVRYHKDQFGREGAPPPKDDKRHLSIDTCYCEILLKERSRFGKYSKKYPTTRTNVFTTHNTCSFCSVCDDNYHQNHRLYNGNPIVPQQRSFNHIYYVTNSEEAVSTLCDCIADAVYYQLSVGAKRCACYFHCDFYMLFIKLELMYFLYHYLFTVMLQLNFVLSNGIFIAYHFYLQILQ